MSLRLQAGNILRIRGPNGSPKSSLLRLLYALTRQRGTLSSRLLWTGHAAGVKVLLIAEENLARLGALHARGATAAIGQASAGVGLRGFEETSCRAQSAGQ